MGLTPQDVAGKEFAQARRGYDATEVDTFLDQVRTTLDTLQRAVAEQSRRAEAAEQKLTKYVSMESSINNAFISAQTSADAIRSSAEAEGAQLREAARAEGERVYREAEAKAREVIREALVERDKIAAEADRLQRSEDEFRKRYIDLLDHFYAEAEKKEFVGETIDEIASEKADDPVDDKLETSALADDQSGGHDVVEPGAVGPAESTEEMPVQVAGGQPVASPEPVIDPFAPKTTPGVVADDVAPAVVPAKPVSAAPSAPVAPAQSVPGAQGLEDLGEIEDDFDIEEID